jgi:hypothetical protein
MFHTQLKIHAYRIHLTLNYCSSKTNQIGTFMVKLHFKLMTTSIITTPNLVKREGKAIPVTGCEGP